MKSAWPAQSTDGTPYRHCCPSRMDQGHIAPCPFAKRLDACDQDYPPTNWRTCAKCPTGCRWVPCRCGLPIRLVRLFGTLEVGWTHAAGVVTSCRARPADTVPA